MEYLISKMAVLIIIEGKQEGDFYELAKGPNVIGRSAALPIHILDMRISREHMKIHFDEAKQQYFAVDLASRHGVFVDEIRIKDKVALTEGNRITIGQTHFLFTLENISSREDALERLQRSKPEIPTLDFSTSPTERFLAKAIRRGEIRLHNFREWAGSPKLTLAIVFTDIIDSTLLTNEMGNEYMNQARRAHFTRTRSLIEKYNGYEIKTNGDEFMAAFHTAVNAFDFAFDLKADSGDKRVSIRAGMHIGPVVVEEEDVQGAAVSYAARVVGMAAKGGVWMSNDVKNHIDQEKAQHHNNLNWQQHPDCELKGFPGKHLLWSVKENV